MADLMQALAARLRTTVRQACSPIPEGCTRRVGRLAARLISWGQWVVVPCALAVALKSATKEWKSVAAPQPEVEFWRTRSSELEKYPRVDFVFVGSSRVGAAIDEGAFVDQFASRAKQRATALNIGLGYSTGAERHLYLRNLFQRYPDRMRGATILIECPGGMPSDFSTWEHCWYHADRPNILTSVVRPKDLWTMWLRTGSTENTVRTGFDYLVRKSPFLTKRDRVGQEIVTRGNQWVRNTLDRLGWAPVVPSPEPSRIGKKADLAATAGIRTDEEGVARVRKLAEEQARLASQNALPQRLSEDAILADTVKMVREAGGNVVFFVMPLHPTQDEANFIGKRVNDREIFRKQAEGWNVTMLDPKVQTSPDDFPDIWHMRRSLAPEFSRRLADAFVDSHLPFPPRRAD